VKAREDHEGARVQVRAMNAVQATPECACSECAVGGIRLRCLVAQSCKQNLDVCGTVGGCIVG
jgi:hypothetical protein